MHACMYVCVYMSHLSKFPTLVTLKYLDVVLCSRRWYSHQRSEKKVWVISKSIFLLQYEL